MSIVGYLACFVDITLFRYSLTVVRSAFGVDKLPLQVILSPPMVHLTRFFSTFLRPICSHDANVGYFFVDRF